MASCSVEDHSAAFYARMKLVDGADRMALRFTLLVKTGVEGDQAVKAPGLRRWHRSKPGVVSLRYRQGLRNLEENATYRAKVDFRWYSSSGAEVLRAQRRSARCRQFVALPNLVAKLTEGGAGKGAGRDALRVAREQHRGRDRGRGAPEAHRGRRRGGHGLALARVRTRPAPS